MSRYLVTGATGFLGGHLVRLLVDAGHEVTALARHEAPLPDGATFARGDVLDPESVARAARGHDGVFHAAGHVSRRPEDAELLRKVHVEGTRLTLDACIAAGVRRAVFVSSSGTIAVSEAPDKISTEEDEAPIALINRWPYYRAKLFAERAALERSGALLPGGGVFEVVSVNPTLLLGPGDERGSSTEDVRLFLEERVAAVPPGGLSFVDVRDAAAGCVLAMERGTAGRRYLLGACNLTVRELFAKLERISGVPAPKVPLPRAPTLARMVAETAERWGARIGVSLGADAVSIEMAHHTWYLDASLAERELGWTARDPAATLADTVADLQARGVVWPRDADPMGGAASVLTAVSRRVAELRVRS